MIKETNVLYCDLVQSREGNNKNLYFQWAIEKCGFGELYFYKEGNEYLCDNELMSRRVIKKILNKFVDSLDMYLETEEELQSWEDLNVKVIQKGEEEVDMICYNKVSKESIRNEFNALAETCILTCPSKWDKT